MNHDSRADSAMAILAECGRKLDKDIYPRVLDGGIVTPSDTASPSPPWATKEHDYEKQGQGRPAAGPWQGTAGWQRPSEGGRTSPRTAPPLICSALRESYKVGLAEVMKAYPNSRVWHQEEGFWLRTESKLLPELGRKAVFLTGIPYASTGIVRAWGFWEGIPLLHPEWIGPRHTNWDGSVCAFEPMDGTWEPGGSLVTLIDLYTIWALRHLHLQIFDRWPGRQVAHHVFERIVELKPGELCGCGSDKMYEECCRQSDLKKDIIAEAAYFIGRKRCPPEGIFNFIRGKTEIPRLMDFLAMM